MNSLHPKVRERLRAAGPIVIPPPPPGLAMRVLALAQRDGARSPEASPEPILAAVMVLAMAVLLAGFLFGSLPGVGTSSTPDFMEASQFIFSQLIP